jgi:hypothetical protein
LTYGDEARCRRVMGAWSNLILNTLYSGHFQIPQPLNFGFIGAGQGR